MINFSHFHCYSAALPDRGTGKKVLQPVSNKATLCQGQQTGPSLSTPKKELSTKVVRFCLMSQYLMLHYFPIFYVKTIDPASTDACSSSFTTPLQFYSHHRNTFIHSFNVRMSKSVLVSTSTRAFSTAHKCQVITSWLCLQSSFFEISLFDNSI